MFAISKKFSLANYRLVDDRNPIQPRLDCTGENPRTLQNFEPSLRLSPSFISLPHVAVQGIAKAELPPSMLPSQGHRSNDAIPLEAAASFSKSTLGRRMILLAACLLPILGCSASFTQSLSSAKKSTTEPITSISTSISPQSDSIVAGQSQQFTAAVSGTTNTSVTWSVNKVAGGNSTTGTISATGLYHAPSASPAGGSVTVAVTSAASTSISSSATVAIQDIVAVSPVSISVQTGGSQQFSATVNGVNSTSVAWKVSGIAGGNSTMGTISSGGLYTAPASAPGSAVTITAVEASGSLASASATVTVVAAKISVVISPQTANVVAGKTQQFTSAVSGTTNTSVTWSVNKVAGGNSTTGTISATGLYHAPSASPAGGSVTVAVTSAANTSISSSATVAIQDIVAVSPVSISVQTGGSQQFSTTVNGVNSTSVAWKVSGIAGGNSTVGTISASGLYSAPAVVPSSTVTVSAVEASGSLASASATVTVVAAKISIVISPQTANVVAGKTQQFTSAVSGTTNTSVSWSVNGVAGGNATTGAISSVGLYHAPSASPAGGSVTVAVTSAASTSISSSATVAIQDIVAVTPASISVTAGATQQFTATVNGVRNTSMAWSVGGVAGGNSTVGTISASGLYSAPAVVPSSTVTVSVVEASGSLASASASVTIAIPKVAISPLTATIAAGRSQQFTATVTNALNKAVFWSVNGVAGGGSAAGTISSAGLYYAPSAPATGGSVTITATSAADSNISAGATVTIPDVVTVTPASISVASGNSRQFAASINGTGSTSVLWSVGGVAGGNNTLGTISASGLYTAPQLAPNAPVEVTATEASDSLASGGAAVTVTGLSHAPITITYGGTYTGNWVSDDPATPAILVQTNEPVFIENSSVTGKGNLIIVKGSGSGANVTIQNVTGTALDPGIAGKQRGSFFFGTAINSLAVTNCTMTGVSFGVYVEQSTLTALSIDNNVANNMEDRASDGNGGFTTVRPSLGHFVILSGVHAASGGDISWNQVIDADGNSSVEDIINIYSSSGQSVANSIRIHDNYLQGAFSPAAVNDDYSGSGIMMDGSSNSLGTATGFVQIYDNQVVHTANAGIGLDAGHDISVTGNSVVSCGIDASGNWFTTTYALATNMWNAYGTSVYFNNTLSGNSGGLVRPNDSGNPMGANIWAPAASATLNNIVGTNDFTNPCFAGGGTMLDIENSNAETAQYVVWLAKLASASETIGSQSPAP